MKPAILIWCLIVAAMCAVPPWTYTSTKRSAGYHAIINPPDPDTGLGVRIDLPRLAVQWVMVSAIAIPIILALRKRNTL